MKESSSATGWDYNNPENGGFEKAQFVEQETGPGLVFVEGGTFTMGRAEQDVMYDWNNRAARVTVSSFYMDQTEVTNFHWLEYMYWLSRTYMKDPDENFFPMVYQNALPDTLCWRTPLGFNEKYVEYYLRHPAYRDYPVVGVSWLQANDYCKWRTDRVNEQILIREDILKYADRTPDQVFNTELYLANGKLSNSSGEIDSYALSVSKDPNPKTEGQKKTKGQQMQAQKPEDYHYGKIDGGVKEQPRISGGKSEYILRPIRMEDGLLLPHYRLPTEAEWEFAASGLIGNLEEGTENVDARRFYPWDGHWVRDENDQFKGAILANFVRGHGDYMGVAGALNDGADVTAPVESYWPNDYGLYNMAGNVSEWVLDVYRPLSSEDFDEFRPFRGNVFNTKQQVLTEAGFKNEMTDFSNLSYDVHGMKEYLNEFERVRYQRISGKEHNTIGKQKYANSTDSARTAGMVNNIKSKHDLSSQVNQGYEPSSDYFSMDRKIDSIEISMLKALNHYLDSAIVAVNEKKYMKADSIIQDHIFNGILKKSPEYWNKAGKKKGITYPLIIPNDDSKGSILKSYSTDAIAMILAGFQEYVTATPGKLKYRNVTEEENLTRLNYRKDDYIDYKDGDIESSSYYDNTSRKADINDGKRSEDLIMYQNDHENYSLMGDSIAGRSGWPTTMISDRSRVYKGGSWADRAYWLNVGNRRYLDERLSMATLGFRCCMDRVGSPHGNNYQGGSGNAFLGIGRRKK
jgi:gliding motility-associated lipoprotein GldJ